MADGKGHRLLTKTAIECLPGWQKKIWKEEIENLLDVYCMYGDSYWGDRKEEASPYVEMPNGKTPMEPWVYRIFKKTAPGKDFFICGYYKLVRYVFEYYISQISESLKKNKIKNSAKFAGVLAHFVEDSGCPSHAIGTDLGVDMELIKLLLPPPSKEKRLMQFHTILEGEYKRFSLKGYKPKLMGLTPEEASFNLLERFTDMLENSIKQIIPMIKAFYRDDYKTLKKHLTESAIFSSRVLADTYHTAFCIAFKKFKKEDIENLKIVNLSDCTPYKWTGWAPFYPYSVIRKSNMSLNRNSKPVPLKLELNNKEKIFKKGFGVGVPFEITYLIPKGVYKKFCSFIGLHSNMGKGGEVIFKIKLDGRVVFNSGIIQDSRALNVEVPLKKGEKISLITQQKTKNLFGKFENQAVWANPFLSKSL